MLNALRVSNETERAIWAIYYSFVPPLANSIDDRIGQSMKSPTKTQGVKGQLTTTFGLVQANKCIYIRRCNGMPIMLFYAFTHQGQHSGNM